MEPTKFVQTLGLEYNRMVKDNNYNFYLKNLKDVAHIIDEEWWFNFSKRKCMGKSIVIYQFNIQNDKLWFYYTAELSNLK